MSEPEARTARLEARIAPETLAMVRRAADLEGRSVSDFVVAAARQAARRTIEETQLLRLAVEDQARFVDALLHPAAPSGALRRAKTAHEALILDEP